VDPTTVLLYVRASPPVDSKTLGQNLFFGFFSHLTPSKYHTAFSFQLYLSESYSPRNTPSVSDCRFVPERCVLEWNISATILSISAAILYYARKSYHNSRCNGSHPRRDDPIFLLSGCLQKSADTVALEHFVGSFGLKVNHYQ
jgi:hypothetical protein